MKKSGLFLSGILMFSFLFIMSCQKTENVDPVSDQKDQSGILKTQIDYCGDPLTVNLVNFDETILAGTVTVGNDAGSLYVTYNLTGPYTIANLAVYAGPIDQVPDGANPDGTGTFSPWYFPYSYYPYIPPTSYTFEIDLSTLPECFILVTYAKVIGPDGIFYAWGKAQTKIPGFWFDYCVQECNPPLEGDETMYAWGDSYAQCFIGLPQLNTKKWGWTNGPLSEDTYEFEIWAGAGQCDLSKGMHVGMLDIDYSGGTVTVTYSMFDGYEMTETHLFVGNDILPKKKNNKYTAAPGQYPYKNGYPMGATSDTYTADGFSGDIYVIAHGVVGNEQ